MVPPGSWTRASLARLTRPCQQGRGSDLRRQGDEDVGGRGHGWTYAEAWTRCTARHLNRALALQQGNMLARIVEEIHAPDRGAQSTRGGAIDLEVEVDDDDRTIAKVPFLLAHTIGPNEAPGRLGHMRLSKRPGRRRPSCDGSRLFIAEETVQGPCRHGSGGRCVPAVAPSPLYTSTGTYVRGCCFLPSGCGGASSAARPDEGGLALVPSCTKRSTHCVNPGFIMQLDWKRSHRCRSTQGSITPRAESARRRRAA